MGPGRRPTNAGPRVAMVHEVSRPGPSICDHTIEGHRSHPNSEVKLDRDDVVLPSGRGWEGSLSHILRFCSRLDRWGARRRSRRTCARAPAALRRRRVDVYHSFLRLIDSPATPSRRRTHPRLRAREVQRAPIYATNDHGQYSPSASSHSAPSPHATGHTTHSQKQRIHPPVVPAAPARLSRRSRPRPQRASDRCFPGSSCPSAEASWATWASRCAASRRWPRPRGRWSR